MLNRCCSHRAKALALLLGFAMVVAGCSSHAKEEQMPLIQPVYPPLQHHLRVSLYFAQQDGTMATEVRSIDLDKSASPEAGLVGELIEGPSGSLSPLVNPATVLNYAFIIGDTAYVDISQPKRQSVERFMQSCIRSLHEAFSVSYLVLTEDGCMPDGVDSGVVSAVQQKGDSASYVQLFFPDKRGQYIIPVVRRLTPPSDGNMVKAILNALQDGPSKSDLFTAVDSDVALVSTRKTNGKMDIVLQANPGSVELYGYACLAMSLLRNISGIRQVRIQAGGQWASDVPGLSDGGYFTASSMQDILGGMVQLYFTGADGKSLIPVERSVSFKEAGDPITAIREIIRGPLDIDKTDALNVLPAGVAIGDILSLKRDGDMAILDMDASFYQACSSVSDEAEMLLLYALVNALTERADIHSVLFLNTGANVETLGSTISLNKPLLRNPGIIIEP